MSWDFGLLDEVLISAYSLVDVPGKVVGRAEYIDSPEHYRVVCRHHGQEVDVWLPASALKRGPVSTQPKSSDFPPPTSAEQR